MFSQQFCILLFARSFKIFQNSAALAAEVFMKYTFIFLCLVLIGVSSCKPKGAPLDPVSERGRVVYLSNCIACHNSDPHKDGSLGPAVAGSTQELLEARVLKGTYPEGYQPKRPSKVMQPLPHLSADIPALFQYLQQPAQ